ncbi:MAG TPA: DUF4382 domain-containing protein [Negativicutes bacterium]|jgi:hypothetical protein
MDNFKSRVTGMIACAFLLSMMIMAGCGSNSGAGVSSNSGPTGKATIKLTDEPNINYDHVWITVTEAWFHKLDIDDPADTGWIKFPLPTPMTIDLSKLTAGATQDVWKGLVLPTGTYRQIRVFLAPTENAALPSLPSGVKFNNEVDYTDSSGVHQAPLRVPAPTQGIKIIPDTPVVITEGSDLKLALDFNVSEDVIQIFRQGQFSSAQATPSNTKEFLLKARLKYFDLNNAAVITGTIARPGFGNFSGSGFGNFSSNQIIVKAEQPNASKTFRVVRNSTTIDSSGKFTLYPLPIFGNASTASYDLVISGRNIDTMIITGVKARKGTNTTNAAVASTQPISTVTDTNKFNVQVNVKPAGAWVSFYQTLPTDPVPYEIKTSHINPFSIKGEFPNPVELPAGPLQVAAWNNTGPLTFSPVTPVEGVGNFKAAAVALLFTRSAYINASSLTPLLNFNTLTLTAPASNKTISGNIIVKDPGLNRGVMLITKGGLLVDNLDVSSQMKVGTNPYTTGNLPGGVAATPLPNAFYDLFVLGWDAAQPDTTAATGIATGVDLQTTNGTADITMNKIQ